jgi:hypothetical protein
MPPAFNLSQDQTLQLNIVARFKAEAKNRFASKEADPTNLSVLPKEA